MFAFLFFLNFVFIFLVALFLHAKALTLVSPDHPVAEVPGTTTPSPTRRRFSSRHLMRQVLNSSKTIAVVLRTWHADATHALQACISALHAIHNLHGFVIITDEPSAAVVREQVVEPLKKAVLTLERRLTGGVKLVVEPTFLRNGHIQQKFSKMTADLYTKAPLIFHLDSDVSVVKWDASCYLRDGLPANEYQKWQSLPGEVRQWKNGSEKLLGVKDVAFEFSRKNQHVYPRAVYSGLRRHLEERHGMPLKEVFQRLRLVGQLHDWDLDRNSTLISDFNLLSGWAFYFGSDLMKFIDLDNPVAKPLEPCVLQCNARFIPHVCCQWWYHHRTGIYATTLFDLEWCATFPSNHPCWCQELTLPPNIMLRLVAGGTPPSPAPGGELWEHTCTSFWGTAGWRCGRLGYCYAPPGAPSCDAMRRWLLVTHPEHIANRCACPDHGAVPDSSQSSSMWGTSALWQRGCTTSFGTKGWQCGPHGFCYGSRNADTCAWIQAWLLDHGQRDAARQCTCPGTAG